MQSRTDTCRAEPIHAEQNRYMQSRTDTCRAEPIHADQNQYMQTRTNTCRPEPIHADWNHSVHDIRLLRFFYGIPWGSWVRGQWVRVQGAIPMPIFLFLGACGQGNPWG